MADIKNITIDGTTYDLKDAKAREDVSDLREELTEITDNAVIPLGGANKYIDLSGSSVTMADGVPQSSGNSAQFSYFLTPCSEGDVFTINGQGGGQTRLWGFVSSSGEILSKSSASVTGTDLIITAPANAVYLIVHTKDGRKSYMGKLLADRTTQLYKSSIDVGALINGKFIAKSDGVEYDSANYSCTDYISVKGGYTIKCSNVALEGSTSVCAYDANKRFLSAILTSDTGNVNVALSASVEFIRITSTVGAIPFCEYIAYPINKAIDDAETDIASLKNAITTNIPLVNKLVGKYIAASDGVPYDSASDDSYYKVPIASETDIVLKGAKVNGSRGIIGFEADGTKVVFYTDTAEINFSFNTADCIYLSFSVATGTTPILQYKEKVASVSDALSEDANVGNYYPKYIESGAYLNGYINYDGSFVSSNSYRATDYVEIIGGTTIALHNVMATAFKLCHFYNEDKEVIESVSWSANEAVDYAEATAPLNAKYIRYGVPIARVNYSHIEYKGKLAKHSPTFDIASNLIHKALAKALVPFAKATSEPIITIIDDDTSSTIDVQRLHTKLQSLGIVGTYACLTRQFTTDNTLCDTLKSYERDGFQTVLHGYTQGSFYKDDSNRDMDACLDDLIHGFDDLVTNNFLDCDFWVTPFGVHDADMQELAQKVGLKCLVNIGSTKLNGDDGEFSRYNLQRRGLNEDTDVDSIKAMIDKCVAENGWLILGTHSAEWATSFDNLDTIVNYALSNGCKFKTLGEAFRIRKPIYDFYDIF